MSLKTSSQETNLLFMATYVNEYVDVLTLLGTEVIPYSGYVIDSDRRFLYMGDTKENISYSIRWSDVRLIELSSMDRQLNKLLKEMPVPQKMEEIN